MKRLSFLCVVVCLVATAFVQTTYSSFPDVAEQHANFDAIEYVQSQGIVNGYPDGTYKPLQTINRAEFTKIVMEALFPNEITGANCFPDVKEEWFAEYVCIAKEKGIINGYPDGKFKPANTINFAEASKIIVNSFGYTTTVDGIWYKPFVDQLATRRAIPTTVASFGKNITRGEMAELVFRLKTNLTTKASHTYNSLLGIESPIAAQTVATEKQTATVQVTGVVAPQVTSETTTIQVTGTVPERDLSSSTVQVTAVVQ